MSKGLMRRMAALGGMYLLSVCAHSADTPLYRLSLSGEQLTALCQTGDPIIDQLGLKSRCQPSQWTFRDFSPLHGIVGSPRATLPSGYGAGVGSLPESISLNITDPALALAASSKGVGVKFGSHDIFSISTPGSVDGEAKLLGYNYLSGSFNTNCGQTMASTGAKVLPNMQSQYSANCLLGVDKIPKAYIDAGLEKLLITFLRPEAPGLPPLPFCMGILIDQDPDGSEATALTAKHCFYDHKSSNPSAAPLLSYAKVIFADYTDDAVVARFIGAQERGANFSIHLEQKSVEFKPKAATGDWIRVRIIPRDLKFPQFDWSRKPELDPEAYKEGSEHQELLLIGPNELADLAPLPPQLQTSWVGTLRFTKNLECRLSRRDIESHCSRHTCQTGSGYSGSPLLRVKNNRLIIVGVHVGDWHDAGCPDADSASGFAHFVSTASDGR